MSQRVSRTWCTPESPFFENKVFSLLKHVSILGTLLSLVLSISSSSHAQQVNYRPGFQMKDISSRVGIDWEHTTGQSGMGYLVEGVTTGLASFDYDLDGFIDLYLLTGRSLRDPTKDTNRDNALYRNRGGFQFANATGPSLTSDKSFGLGVVVADYNQDGFPDLYLSNYGPNRLLMNAGDGTFVDMTEESGTDNGNKFGGGCAFCDFNADGILDLYAGNYVDFTLENAVFIERNGKIFHSGPVYYKSVPDTLYFGNGDGTFTDVSIATGIGKHAGPTMGLIATDLTGDGFPDVYTCNDGKANFLFVNDGKGNFTEEALIAGLAFDFRGTANASMGVDIGDYDGDGLFDLITTNYQNELPVLYRNLGEGVFEDASTSARVAEAIIPHVTWGTSFMDFDNDGQLDLFIAAGHFDDAEISDDRTAKKVRDFLMMNRGGKYTDVSTQVGLTAVESSRGAVFEDFDNDGDIDIVVLNANAKPTVYRNDSESPHHYVAIRLVDTLGNRDGIGARVHVEHKVLTKDFVVLSGRGYQSHYGDRLHIGLNQVSEKVTSSAGLGAKDINITVTWADGKSETYEVAIDQINLVLRGGQSYVLPLNP